MEARWFDLEDDDLTWADETKAFVDDVVTPYVQATREGEWQSPPADRVPWDLVEGADRMGYGP